MSRIILVRPGQTDYDEQLRIKGRLSIPLNRAGATEVEQIVRELKRFEFDLDYVLTAPCRAAEQTGQAIADEYDIGIAPVTELQNIGRGLWEGTLVREIREWQPKVYRRWQDRPETVRAPEGEMLSEAAARVIKALSKRLRRYSGVLVVVIPEPLATIVECILTGRPFGDLWETECGSGSWVQIDGKLEHATVR